MRSAVEHNYAMGKHQSLASTSTHMYGLSDAKSKNKIYKKTSATIAFILFCVIIIFFNISKPDIISESFCGLDEMSNEAFYIELSSNATSYPWNTVANFKNDISLLRPLRGNWEVALVEMSYTKSWKNLPGDYIICFYDNEEEGIFSREELKKEGNSTQKMIYPIYSIVKGGYYDSVAELCKEIEYSFEPMGQVSNTLVPLLNFDNITKLISITPGFHKKSMLMPWLSHSMKQILGFTDYSYSKPKLNKDGKCEANRPADINAGLHTLFVYCDLIEPQYIGDIRAKLLRTVQVPSNTPFGHQVVVTYPNPHYVPVLVNDFEHIEIDIKDDTNTRIPFMYGRSRIKLHFRKKND